MKKIPESVISAWENQQGPFVFTTVNIQGIPNSIYATSVSKVDNNKILIANNYFNKTMKNIESGSMGSILFITSEDKSFQIKGSIKYYTEGEYFDDMKKWNAKRLPGHGVVVLEVNEVFSGGTQLL